MMKLSVYLAEHVAMKIQILTMRPITFIIPYLVCVTLVSLLVDYTARITTTV